ncbi:MAG: hypothetical protein FRX48_04292 [Lasallia pustulata]|uniref:Uncharacterized protein n=1 Tax=Lasallia pustulata TaxID=136370 RepID=A0A5M8PT26_9LECA|nr:MAG: hypothetical protein FRX48_04292 [Lasallia pustulata]
MATQAVGAAPTADAGFITHPSPMRAAPPAGPRPRRAASPHSHLPKAVQVNKTPSYPESPPTAPRLSQDDVSLFLGISISRAQSHVISEQCPYAERAAVIDDIGVARLFDGTDSSVPSEEAMGYDTLKSGTPSGVRIQGSKPAPLQDSPKETTRPGISSHWHPDPSSLETSGTGRRSHRSGLGNRARASSGPTGRLADLNVKRFLSSLSLPSMPKGPAFKDIFGHSERPSLVGLLKNSPTPRQAIHSRSKRHNTLYESSAPWYRTDDTDDRQNKGSAQAKNPNPEHIEPEQASAPLQLDQDESRPDPLEPSQNSPRRLPQRLEPQQLRRATSDHSLFLRNAISHASSLGDDSRWENVQDQVNNRFKAIVDSLQNSSVKSYNIPSISLSALRPDFITKRPSMDSKQHSSGDVTFSAATRPLAIDASAESAKGEKVPTQEPSSHDNPPKHQHPQLNCALENLTGDVLVMGGYRGSILRSAKPPHRQQWVPVKVGLNIRKVNLEIGLSPEDEERMEETIIASGMLTHYGPVDISRRLLKRMRTCKNALEGRLRVHDYGYDWRLSPHLLSRKLVKFLESLPSNQAGVPLAERGVTVVAHSLGGLITRHTVNERPELFAAVLYAGTPQHCVNVLGPLRNGDEVLFSSRVLTAQVNFTMRSTFALLPEVGRCFIDKETKEEYPVDFFNVEHWKEYRFSPCIASPLPPLGPEKKGLLGSMAASLPIHGKRDPVSDPSKLEALDDAVNNTLGKADKVGNPANHTMNMQMGTHRPSAATKSTIPPDAALAYLERTLAETLEFKRALSFRPEHAAANLYPPFAVIYGTSVPTVYGARVNGREGIKRADAYDELAFASGDGVCLARAAMLPRGYAVCKGGRTRTERGHVGLLGDLEAVGKCLMALGEARRGGVGWSLRSDAG